MSFAHLCADVPNAEFDLRRNNMVVSSRGENTGPDHAIWLKNCTKGRQRVMSKRRALSRLLNGTSLISFVVWNTTMEAKYLVRQQHASRVRRREPHFKFACHRLS